MILVTFAIAATFEAGLDGLVRVLAILGMRITAAFLTAPAAPETRVRTSACIARTSRSSDGASAGMVVTAARLRLVQRQQHDGRHDQNLQNFKHQRFEHLLVLCIGVEYGEYPGSVNKFLNAGNNFKCKQLCKLVVIGEFA